MEINIDHGSRVVFTAIGACTLTIIKPSLPLGQSKEFWIHITNGAGHAIEITNPTYTSNGTPPDFSSGVFKCLLLANGQVYLTKILSNPSSVVW